ncbi:MAG TPA: AarF/UbiB family protein, partial [Acidimicrobiales bacterium]|nr:AarF/UbiB family protein [Acidimicrobiales bacterium]
MPAASPTPTPPPVSGPGPESVPRVHPRRLPTPTRLELVQRGARIARVTTRHLAPVAVRQARELRSGALAATVLARPLRLTFEELGGTFMKFGQMIASSPGLFGDEMADEFRACLDTGPSVPFAAVRDQVEEDLGRALDDAFVEFELEPIGRASIAVVHRARLLDGRQVAVKVLRPGIEKLV